MRTGDSSRNMRSSRLTLHLLVDALCCTPIHCTAGGDKYNDEQRPYSDSDSSYERDNHPYSYAADFVFYPGVSEHRKPYRSSSYNSNHTTSYAPHRSYYGPVDKNIDMWDVLTRRNRSNCGYSPRHGYDCHGYSE
jgi:hypothetical protein